MKKLIRNIILLMIPILLYYGVFLCFEPNNYFGLRAETPSGVPFGALREYENNPVNSVIIGDSRVAHFDMELVEETAGRPFGNLAYGGASLRESLDLLEWWMEEYPDIDEVVFSLSYYTLNEGYDYDRVDAIKRGLHNPLVYLTGLSFHLETLQTVRDWLQGKPLYGGDHETEDPADYTYVEYTAPDGQEVTLRSRLAKYLAYTMPLNSTWSPNTEQFDRLVADIEKYTAQGVRFVVVLPPTHPSMMEYAIKPYGIYQPMAEMVEELRQTDALVLDYEITDPPDFRDDQYFDGFHLDAERGLPEWTQMLFMAIDAA